MEYLEDKTNTGPVENGLYRFKCIKDHKGPYTSSEVDWGGVTLVEFRYFARFQRSSLVM